MAEPCPGHGRWPSHGQAMADPWTGHGRAIWTGHGRAMAEPWPGHGQAMAEPWPSRGRAMAEPWPSRGRAVAEPWPWPWPSRGRAVAWPWPWPNHGEDGMTLPAACYEQDSHNPCIGPQTGGGPIASRDLVGGAGAWVVSFGRNWPLAASPGHGTARKRFLSTVGCSVLDSQGLATILDPFRPIFAELGPDAADVCC